MSVISSTLNKICKFIDNHVPMSFCIIVVIAISLKVALWLGDANPLGTFFLVFCFVALLRHQKILPRAIGDFWCHFSWLKITHRQPIEYWYDNNEFTHLDYPPLAAYFHYFLSFIYVYLNPNEFYHLHLTGYERLGPNKKSAVRQAVLAADVVTYYPVVIYVVLANLKELRKIHKLCIMLIFLNMPMFAYIEHANTQVNGPHLAFILLCLHFMINDRFVAATVCFTLGITYKHACAPMVVPIVLYVVARAWKLRRESSSNIFIRVALFIFDGLKCAAAGVVTLFAVLLPLLLRPPAYTRMYNVIFGTKVQGLVHPAPTIWYFIRLIYGEVVINEWITIPFTIYAVVTVLLIPLVFKRPCKEVCLTSFVVFGITHAMFGYIVHEKHIQYMYLALLLIPFEYANYLPYVLCVSAWNIYPLTTRLQSTYYSFFYNVGFVAFVVLFGASFQTSYLAKADPQADKSGCNKIVQTESRIGRVILWVLDGLKEKTEWLLPALIAMMFYSYATEENATRFYNHRGHEFDLICDFMIKCTFVALTVFYVYCWTVLLKATFCNQGKLVIVGVEQNEIPVVVKKEAEITAPAKELIKTE